MMKRFILVSLLCLVTILGFAMSDAMAIGLGVYLNGSSGSSSWTPESSSSNSSFERDSSHTGFGFVLDTAVAKDKLFNYRLNLGYESSTYEPNGGSSGKWEMDGFSLSNSFGFGVLRTEVVRLWLGPQLSFSFASGGSSNTDLALFGIGIAPVLGVNINLGKVVTLAFDAGYKINKYFASIDSSSYSYSNYYGSSTSYSSDSYDVLEGQPFLNFSLIFRLGDRY